MATDQLSIKLELYIIRECRLKKKGKKERQKSFDEQPKARPQAEGWGGVEHTNTGWKYEKQQLLGNKKS